MTESDFMDYLDIDITMLKLTWDDKKKRLKALKSMKDLINNYLED